MHAWAGGAGLGTVLRRHGARGRRLRAAHEAGRRPARPDLDRGGRRARRHGPRGDRRGPPRRRRLRFGRVTRPLRSPRLIWCPRRDPRPAAAVVGRRARRDRRWPRLRPRVPRREHLAARLRRHRPRARQPDRAHLVGGRSSSASRSASRSTCSRCRGPRCTSGPVPWLALSVLESLFVAGGARADRARVPLGAAGELPRAGSAWSGCHCSSPGSGACARRRPVRSRTAGSPGVVLRSARPRARSPTSSRGSGRPVSGSSWSPSSRASSSGCACAGGRTSARRSRSRPSRIVAVALPAWPTIADRRATGRERAGQRPGGILRRAGARRRARPRSSKRPSRSSTSPASTCCSGPRAAPTSIRLAASRSRHDLRRPQRAARRSHRAEHGDHPRRSSSSTPRCCGARVRARSTATTSAIPVPFGEYIPDRAFWEPLAPDLIGLIQRGYTPGTNAPVFDLGDAITGLAICFDVIYDELIWEGARDGAELYMFQTNNADFRGTDENQQQLAIARLRAIETGRSVVNISTVGTQPGHRPDRPHDRCAARRRTGRDGHRRRIARGPHAVGRARRRCSGRHRARGPCAAWSPPGMLARRRSRASEDVDERAGRLRRRSSAGRDGHAGS